LDGRRSHCPAVRSWLGAMRSSFWSLPGPSQFVHEIHSEVRQGVNVIVMLPLHTPDGLGVELERQVKDDETLFWRSLRLGPGEEDGGDPFRGLSRLVAIEALRPELGELARAFAGSVVLIEAMPEAELHAWEGFLPRFAAAGRSLPPGEAGTLVLVIPPAPGGYGLQPTQDPALSVVRWQGQTSRVDSQLCLADEPCLSRGHSLEHELRLAVAMELAGYDLALAARLMDLPLKSLLDPVPTLQQVAQERAWTSCGCDPWAEGREGHWNGRQFLHSAAAVAEGKRSLVEQRVWKAELSLLFPEIERLRLELLDSVRPALRVPMATPYGTIERIDDLEIGQIDYQIQHSSLAPGLRRKIHHLAEMRRSLAHTELVKIDDLVGAGLIDRSQLASQSSAPPGR
jgi:hypothetical protein